MWKFTESWLGNARGTVQVHAISALQRAPAVLDEMFAVIGGILLVTAMWALPRVKKCGLQAGPRRR
jgi:hypothetical protein